MLTRVDFLVYATLYYTRFQTGCQTKLQMHSEPLSPILSPELRISLLYIRFWNYLYITHREPGEVGNRSSLLPE